MLSKSFLFLILGIFKIVSFTSIRAEEVFDSRLEALSLKNICQITFSSMGFEKAGEAYFSPDGENIVFQAIPVDKKHYQIYKMNLKEKIPYRVSTGKGACTCSYFSPDGQKILFASSHEDPLLNFSDHSTCEYRREGREYKWDLTPYMNIYQSNLDGSNLTPLTQGIAYHAECSYSSDGLRIVYASNESGSMNIYTMNLDGSDVYQVTHDLNCYNGGPFFAPDGKHIIFRSDRDKKHYLQLYMIQDDGQNEVQLTSNHAVNWAPYWHPNGKVVAFTTSLHGHSHYEIYLINTETKVLYRLTHNATFDGLPVFNKEGTQVMWTSKRSNDNTCQIFIADFIMPKELE